MQARPLPVPFFYKPGRLPAFSSSVCLQTWPVSFLCMFENPACSFSVSVCLKTWPIPFLCVSAGPVYSCSYFFLCVCKPGFFLSAVCLQTRSIPALFLICLQNWHRLFPIFHPLHVCKPRLFLLFFLCVCEAGIFPIFHPLYVCKPARPTPVLFLFMFANPGYPCSFALYVRSDIFVSLGLINTRPNIVLRNTRLTCFQCMFTHQVADYRINIHTRARHMHKGLFHTHTHTHTHTRAHTHTHDTHIHMTLTDTDTHTHTHARTDAHAGRHALTDTCTHVRHARTQAHTHT